MSFKSFNLTDDFAPLSTAINETISITGSIIATLANVKYYRNVASGSAAIDLGGYFETVYDAAPSSSLSSPLLDITFGISTGSAYNVAATATSSQSDKVKVYRQWAAVLLGNPDSKFSIGSTSRNEAVFISLKRNLSKDEIKKGTVALTINSTAPAQYTASDAGAAATFQQSLGGDFAPLKYNGTGSEVGQVWYNAGVIILHPDTAWGAVATWSGTKTLINVQSSGNINSVVDGVRTHLELLALNNQTNLQSAVYFCRAFNSEFNYSSNATFTDSTGLIRVTSGSNILTTRTYVTTIGLYDENDNLLAVGKTNRPVLKSPETEAIFRLRLDFAILPIPLFMPHALVMPSLFLTALALFCVSHRTTYERIRAFFASAWKWLARYGDAVSHLLPTRARPGRGAVHWPLKQRNEEAWSPSLRGTREEFRRQLEV